VITDTEAVYLYGLDILGQQQTERLSYAHDGLGSVRQLVDTTGQIETNYAYDPFGVPLVGGDVYNPYQFTGEAWDAEVELLYLRARYYQPEVGRFVTKDPWAGTLWRAGLLNPYNYVGCNPVNRIDRTGLDCEGPGCPCPTVSPTAVPPECIPTGSVMPGMTPGTRGVSVTPRPVRLPYPAMQTPSVGSIPAAPVPSPQPTVQAPSVCSVPTPPVVPTPVAQWTWTPAPDYRRRFWFLRGPWDCSSGGPPQVVPPDSYCPEKPPLIAPRTMSQIADWVDAASSAADQSGWPEMIDQLCAHVGLPPWAGPLIVGAPDLASAWLRSSAQYYRECGYY